MRRKNEMKAAAGNAVCEEIDLEDILRLLRNPRPSRLAQALEEAIEQLHDDHLWYVGPLARQFSSLLTQAALLEGWSRHHLFAHLLLPTLVSMRARKTKAFGILLAATKSLWAPEDWPDPDTARAEAMREAVTTHFLSNGPGPDVFHGLWLDLHLRLDCFKTLHDVFPLICDSVTALRLYCSFASPEARHSIIRRLIAAASAGDRQERRRKYTLAADIIDRFQLDRIQFPEVVHWKNKCWMCYIVHRLPLHLVEDYARGDVRLLTLCVEQLIRAETWASAMLLFQKYEPELSLTVKPDLVEKLKEQVGKVQPAVDSDRFAPWKPEALRLAICEEQVIWCDTAELVFKAKECLQAASLVGIDLEWSCVGDWLQPTLALMQLATVDRVFLVDLAKEPLRDDVSALLQTLFAWEQPLLIGFAFHNDVRVLAKSPWATATKELHGFCDLQQLGGNPREGLASQVARLLQAPFCKAEQRSYWHRRPLRAAQRHYAALDAYVLLQVAAAFAGVPLTQPVQLAACLHQLAPSVKGKHRREVVQ